jgi:hypothetical protein
MGYLLSLSKSATVIGLNLSEWSLLICGVALAIGIAGEIRSGIWRLSKHVCEYLVLWAVLGELISDGGVFFFSSQLERISNIEIAEVSKHAADARERAAKIEKETVVLRDQLRTQGSRAALLWEPRSQELFAKIEPFRGQKIQVAQCGRPDNEVTLGAAIIYATASAQKGRGPRMEPTKCRHSSSSCADTSVSL